MTNKNKTMFSKIEQINPDAMRISGYDDCIVGFCETFDGTKLLYSENKILEKLMKNRKYEEALEYFEYNILRIYLGAHSPVFLMDLEKE